METNRLLKTELARKMHRITEEELTRLKQISLEILTDIAVVCEREKIPYMLGGGTALGAVRHQGFIPWDDDIDINVPRSCIDRLLDAVEAEYGDKYYMEAPLRTPEYWSSFVQIHRNGTLFREHRMQERDKCGVKIDIFPIENTYSGKFRRFLHGVQCDLGLLILSCWRMYAWRREYLELAAGTRYAVFLVRVKGMIGMLFAPAHRFWYRKIQKCLSKCRDESTDYVVIPSGKGHFRGEIYPRKQFLSLEPVLFEGRKFMISRMKTEYLRQLYGEDYMRLPPEEEREYHVLYELKL